MAQIDLSKLQNANGLEENEYFDGNFNHNLLTHIGVTDMHSTVN